MQYGEYIFGFPDGNPDYRQAIERENELFEVFLWKFLTRNQLSRRKQLRTMEKAIQIVVDEILENAKI